MKNPLTRASNAWKAFTLRRAMPLRLELSLVDHCNLNCKGCTHYCPIAPDHFMSVAEVEEALEHLSTVNPAMFTGGIYLLGGEPLLHPRLPHIITTVHSFFPDTTVKLLTNGLKVNTMNEDFWDACRTTGTVLSVTVYPVKIDYDAVKKRCDKEGVAYEIFHQPDSEGYFFTKHTIDDVNTGNRWLNHLRCYQVGCLTLRDGKIYPCSTAAYAHLVNARFDRNFRIDDRRDYIRVKDVRSAADLERLKNHSTPFCRYCVKLEPMAWAPSARRPDEWLP